MKNAALLVSCVFVLVGVTGCKSEIEKAADAVCACAEKKGDDAKKCLDDASKAAKEKLGDKKLDDDAIKNMSDKDKDAMKRGAECGEKAYKASTEK
jgi:hypothetical protein